MTHYKLVSLATIAFGMSATGCIAESRSQGPEETAIASEAIINGTSLTEDTRGSPLLQVGSRSCSSTLLGDQWVLTTHSCLTNEGVTTGGTPVTPSSVFVTLLSWATAIGKQVYLHPTSDVALLQLQSSLLSPASTPYVNSLHAGASWVLPGQSLYCQGWGFNTFTGGGNMPRSASINVSQMESDGYQLTPNPSGQIQWLGDAGSPCWSSQGFITGVTSTCQYTGTIGVPGGTVISCHHVGVDSFRSWARSIVNAGPGIFDTSRSWFSLRSTNTSGYADFDFGYGPAGAGWIPIAGDWNGDGIDTVGLYQPSASAFYLRNAHAGGNADITFGFGPAGAGWIPITGDWNGDGMDTVGLYEPSTSTFRLRNAHAGGASDILFGYGPAGAGWIPITGDWNGDGVVTVGLYQPSASAFYLRNAHAGGNADITFNYGPAGAGWLPIAGDWNGDGIDTVGLYEPATGNFYLRNAHAGGNADVTFTYGPPGRKPVVGNWSVSYR